MTFAFKKLQIHISFLFLAVFFAVAFFDKSGLFGLSMLALLIHEAGHFCVMFLCGKRVTALSFRLFGIEIISRESVLSYPKEILIAAGGIVYNIAVFFAFKNVYFFFAAINLVVACYNLLPIGSLDGGQIVEYLLLTRLVPQKAERIALFISIVFLIPVLTLLIFMCFRTKNPSLLIFGGYLTVNVCAKAMNR